jgi:hypothetical protein
MYVSFELALTGLRVLTLVKIVLRSYRLRAHQIELPSRLHGLLNLPASLFS